MKLKTILCVICVICGLFSCTTQRVVTADYVHDTLYVSRVVHDSIAHVVLQHDTVIKTQRVTVETVIRQDSAGKVLSRETSRTTDNDTYQSHTLSDLQSQVTLLQDSLRHIQQSDKTTVKEAAEQEGWLTHLWKEILQVLGIILVLAVGFVIGRFWSQIRQVLPI